MLFRSKSLEQVNTEQENQKQITLETSKEEALNILVSNIENNEPIKREVEIPFHLNSSTFTIMPGTSVFTDEYLGLDGNDTERRPFYSSDTPRTPESAVMQDKNSREIKRVYSDEEMHAYLQNNWEIIGVNSFDGFYKLDRMIIEKERGMKR